MQFTTFVLVVLGLAFVFLRLLRWRNLQQRRSSFRKFETERHCARPTASATSSLWKNFWHKVSLLRQGYGDLLNDYAHRKFQTHGATHAVLNEIGLPKSVHSIDPVNLHAVLISSFDDWTVYKGRRNALAPLAQVGVLTTAGPLWHNNRKLLHRSINTSRVRDTTDLERDVRLLFEAVGPVQSNGWTDKPIDLSDLIPRLAHDMSTRYLFGSNAELQLSGIRARERPDEKPSETAQAIDAYISAHETVVEYVSWRSALGASYWLADDRRYRKACKTLERMADLLVSIARARRSESAESKDFVLDHLLASIPDPVQVRENVLELTIAGQNMTGTVLEWALAELAAHPAVYARLREEVLATFGSDENADGDRAGGTNGRQEMTWGKLSACPTLQNVISETLRCHPIVATLVRTAVRDTVLPRGGGPDGDEPIAVPKGASFMCNLYLLHRRKEEWGEDAWVWNPDRWIGRKTGPEYVPYGAGSRICLGRQISLTEMSFVLARFAQHYQAIRVPWAARNLEHQFRNILRPKNGVHVLLQAGSTRHE